MKYPPCVCGHNGDRHHLGSRSCQDCKCDGYDPLPRELCEEARAAGNAIASKYTLGNIGQPGQLVALPMAREISSLLQDVIEQRDSWQREAERLLLQRDEAVRRATKLQAALKSTEQELVALRTAIATFSNAVEAEIGQPKDSPERKIP